ncbi:uncharacterized protein LOC121871034 [Homarus americanus]|uniref:uncharacterized protein LOC121871034 n=1 Tax=Homarus americanus TaxID=6706 RepID=UPI001C45E027|nr:uncharacterized protein LOC121871034 [Homarus americanus]
MASISRHNVASGGIYDLPRVSYSESTRLLLKELLQEAAVNSQHQRHIERWVGGGGSLPRQEALTVPSQATPRTRCLISTSNTPPPHIQTKRSHEAIKKMGLYEPNMHYVPPPPKYGPGSKERCQELMAYGKEGATLHPTPGRKVQKQAHHLHTDRFTERTSICKEQLTSNGKTNPLKERWGIRG